jgi:hypothetical protein
MEGKCDGCLKPCTIEDSAECCGPCERVFHYVCTGLSKNTLKCLMESPNLSFKCDMCTTKCYKPLEDKLTALTKEVTSMKSLITSLLSNSMVKRVAQPTKVTAKSIPNNVANTPAQDDVFLSPIPTPSFVAKKQPTQPTTEILGTGPQSEIFNLAEPKFWMYLSGLDPATDDSEIDAYLKSVFQSDTIKSVKLLPQNRNPDTCEFVSFKIGFPLNLKERALDPKSWPSGITVREFVDRKPKKPILRPHPQRRDTNGRPPRKLSFRSRPKDREFNEPRSSSFRYRQRSQSRNRENYGRRDSYRTYRY